VVKGLPESWGTCSRTVSLDRTPLALSYSASTIAVGSMSGDVIILDGVIGSQVAALFGHTDWVESLTFSPDGILLVSGSHDCTVRLWDIQTGGVVKTFAGHTHFVCSVSISADCTKVASGSLDDTIRLWDIQTGECYYIIQQHDNVKHVVFSPTNPQYLLFISGNEVWHWDINGHRISPVYGGGSHVAFSPDGTQFVLCNEAVVTVQNSDSREVVTKFHVVNGRARYCCFSPDGRLIAVAVDHTANIWDITSPDPHLVETFIGHTEEIRSLSFSSPSSLISVSDDESVRFWQIGGSPTDPVEADPKFTPSTSASIRSVTLQAKDGIAISSNFSGVVKTWDILTGLCKASFQTPAEGDCKRDVQLIGGRLILVWFKDKKVHIWDTEKGELLQTLDASEWGVLRISGDGSKVFCLDRKLIRAWSMWTWEPVGEAEAEEWEYLNPLQVDSSRIWVQLKDQSTLGWDFGTSGSSPVPLSNPSSERPRLDVIHNPWGIKDTVTGKDVFKLSGRYRQPNTLRWDGRYLAVGYKSGEVLILDFYHVHPE